MEKGIEFLPVSREDMIDRGSRAIEVACTLGLTAAMNEFNRRNDTGDGRI